MELILIIVILILSLSIVFLCILLYKSRKEIISLKNSLEVQDIENAYHLERLTKILITIEEIKRRI